MAELHTGRWSWQHQAEDLGYPVAGVVRCEAQEVWEADHLSD